ncbi:hypothetical protein TELCIR_16790 [Teladorsagia circumcincta]|uniref:USP domain-containing protein n=1 Tax=Teladorsagia circumcincta TaxID=45464 RepID=A0A2G9TUH4_TELCI|nr:hypothetical protein TELCIR_16790 [Teladorsagia circumcincta]
MSHTSLIYCCPSVLVLQILCFNNAGRKIFKEIDVEKSLSLNPFTYAKQGGDLYELAGVVSHAGDLTDGHYIAMAKGFDGEYHYFDDTLISYVDEKRNFRRKGFSPYLIIYRRMKPNNFALEKSARSAKSSKKFDSKLSTSCGGKSASGPRKNSDPSVDNVSPKSLTPTVKSNLVFPSTIKSHLRAHVTKGLSPLSCRKSSPAMKSSQEHSAVKRSSPVTSTFENNKKSFSTVNTADTATKESSPSTPLSERARNGSLVVSAIHVAEGSSPSASSFEKSKKSYTVVNPSKVAKRSSPQPSTNEKGRNGSPALPRFEERSSPRKMDKTCPSPDKSISTLVSSTPGEKDRTCSSIDNACPIEESSLNSTKKNDSSTSSSAIDTSSSAPSLENAVVPVITQSLVKTELPSTGPELTRNPSQLSDVLTACLGSTSGSLPCPPTAITPAGIPRFLPVSPPQESSRLSAIGRKTPKMLVREASSAKPALSNGRIGQVEHRLKMRVLTSAVGNAYGSFTSLIMRPAKQRMPPQLEAPMDFFPSVTALPSANETNTTLKHVAAFAKRTSTTACVGNDTPLSSVRPQTHASSENYNPSDVLPTIDNITNGVSSRNSSVVTNGNSEDAGPDHSVDTK